MVSDYVPPPFIIYTRINIALCFVTEMSMEAKAFKESEMSMAKAVKEPEMSMAKAAKIAKVMSTPVEWVWYPI